ncbi:MAG: thioredoxin [Dehalococcoidia bacterium]|tara:strand:- start:75 stop:404 length:330 start_codon:yes stop_codon:yes gene_type:complete
MSEAVEITDENFQQEVLNSDTPVLVDFWADWCQPCKMIAPVVEQIAEEYDGKVKIGKLDVDSNQQTSQAMGIRGIPALIIFNNGKPVDQIIGVVPKSIIQKKIDEVLAS